MVGPHANPRCYNTQVMFLKELCVGDVVFFLTDYEQAELNDCKQVFLLTEVNNWYQRLNLKTLQFNVFDKRNSKN